MKILLDENLPAKLRLDFEEEHHVFTAREMSWNGRKDGPLLQLLAAHEFDLLITVDKGLRHQQNLTRFPIIIGVLRGINNKHQTLQPLVEKLMNYLSRTGTDAPLPGQAAHITEVNAQFVSTD